MYSDDHLWRLLYDGPTRGENSLDGWDLRVQGGATPQLARMVSVHESFHSQYAFTAAHEIAGHFLPWRPPAWGRRGRSSGQVAEYAVSSDLLIGAPCRENAPPVERLWATWAPNIGPPGVADDGDAGLARVTRLLLSAAFPDPGSLLAGPEPGSVVIACCRPPSLSVSTPARSPALSRPHA